MRELVCLVICSPWVKMCKFHYNPFGKCLKPLISTAFNKYNDNFSNMSRRHPFPAQNHFWFQWKCNYFIWNGFIISWIWYVIVNCDIAWGVGSINGHAMDNSFELGISFSIVHSFNSNTNVMNCVGGSARFECN